jgi:GT2 family glycosyltransferase
MFKIFVPYSIEKNIGRHYNDCMELVGDEEFGIFVDGDTIFTTTNFGHQIQDIIKQNPDCRAFTGVTNRVNCKWQIAPGVDQDNNDILYHRRFGKLLQQQQQHKLSDHTDEQPMSGFLIALRHDLWWEMGGFLEQGMIGIDNDFHRRVANAGARIYCADGLYLFHWYMGDGGFNRNTDHLT